MDDEITVIVADDQPLIRNGLAALLNAENGIQVVSTAADGRETIDAVAAYLPKLVLMDIHMPGMDGLEATRIIKEQYPDVGIIMLTTFVDEEYVWGALKAGAIGYLLKDTETSQMVQTIRECLSGRISYPASIHTRLVAAAEHSGAKDSTSEVKWANLDVQFTRREQQIIEILMEGKSNREIANHLFLSEGTVKNYLGGIYEKLQVSKRGEAMVQLRKRMEWD